MKKKIVCILKMAWNKVQAGVNWVLNSLVSIPSLAKAVIAVMLIFVCCTGTLFAQDYTAGASAIDGVTTGLKSYIPAIQKLLYIIAAIVSLVGAISVFVKMNNEEQDVKKSIMLIIGACVFLIAAAQALPAFFGY